MGLVFRGVAMLPGICNIAVAAAAGLVVRLVDMGTKKAVPLGIAKVIFWGAVVTAESVSSVRSTVLLLPLQLGGGGSGCEIFFFLVPLSFSSTSISVPPLLSLPKAGEYIIL